MPRHPDRAPDLNQEALKGRSAGIQERELGARRKMPRHPDRAAPDLHLQNPKARPVEIQERELGARRKMPVSEHPYKASGLRSKRPRLVQTTAQVDVPYRNDAKKLRGSPPRQPIPAVDARQGVRQINRCFVKVPGSSSIQLAAALAERKEVPPRPKVSVIKKLPGSPKLPTTTLATRRAFMANSSVLVRKKARGLPPPQQMAAVLPSRKAVPREKSTARLARRTKAVPLIPNNAGLLPKKKVSVVPPERPAADLASIKAIPVIATNNAVMVPKEIPGLPPQQIAAEELESVTTRPVRKCEIEKSTTTVKKANPEALATEQHNAALQSTEDTKESKPGIETNEAQHNLGNEAAGNADPQQLVDKPSGAIPKQPLRKYTRKPPSVAKNPKKEVPELLQQLLREQGNVSVQCISLIQAEEVQQNLGNEAAGNCYADELECQICCNDVPIEYMVQCSEGHLFCCECLKNYAQEAVYGHGHISLKCMHDDCEAPFPRSQLDRALPDALQAKYDERMTEDNVNLAHLEGFIRCTGCGFGAVLDFNVRYFRCPIRKCQKEFCRYCKEESKDHRGLGCKQVEKKDETEIRKAFEEKMTEAKIRTCATCKARFTKEGGCNTIVCKCSAKMCYICRATIRDYEHFCRHVRSPQKQCQMCNKCFLWSNAEEDDQLAIEEIRKEATKERTTKGFLDEKLVGAPSERV